MNKYGIYTKDSKRLSHSEIILAERFGNKYCDWFDKYCVSINNIIQPITIRGVRYYIVREKELVMQPIVVNLFGGPGSGKSTLSAGVFSLLKLHGVNCELVTEFAKDLTWEERNVAISNQYYIFGKQHHRLYRLQNKVDVIITDAPLLFNVVYGKLYSNVDDVFFDLVYNLNAEFNNLNFFLNRTKLYEESGRSQTFEEAKHIDEIITDVLEKGSWKFNIVDGDYKGINTITNCVLNYFDKNISTTLCSKI